VILLPFFTKDAEMPCWRVGVSLVIIRDTVLSVKNEVVLLNGVLQSLRKEFFVCVSWNYN